MQHYTTKPPDETAPRTWLEQWPRQQRAFIANTFYAAVRAGASTPALVVQAVRDVLATRVRRAHRRQEFGVLVLAADLTALEVSQSLRTTPEAAYAYAQTVLDRESLPTSERVRRKQAQGQHYQQAFMRTKPPTAKQLGALQSRQYAGELPANRAAASELLEVLLRAERGQS